MKNPLFIHRPLLFKQVHYLQLSLLMALLTCGASVARASAQTDGLITLASGVAIEGQLSGGQVHTYQFAMEVSQLAKININVQGVNLHLSLSDANGQQLDEKKIAHLTTRSDIMLWEAQAAGVYRLQVRADGKDSDRGKYTLKVEVTPASEIQSQAFRKYREAQKLHVKYLADPKTEPLNQTIKAYKEALELWRGAGNREMEGRALFAVGRLIYDIDEDADAPEKTIAYYLQALPLFQALGLKDNEATTLNNLGGAYSFIGNLSKSLEYTLKSEALSEDGAPSTDGLKQLGISNLYNRLGEYQLALEHGLKALAIHRRLGDQFYEMGDHMFIGEAYRLMGEPFKALEHANQGLALAPQFKKIGRAFYLYILVGKIYNEAGDQQKALSYFTQALEISRQQGSLTDQAVSLENLGDLYRETGDKTKALDYYGQAEPLYKTHGRKSGEAQIALKVGALLSESGEFEKALDYQNRAYEFFHASQSRRFEIGSLYEVAKTYRLKGDTGKARDLFNQALSLTNALDNQHMAAQIYRELAAIARTEGDRPAAIALMTQALKTIENLRSRFIIQDLKTIFSAKAEDFYADYIDLLMSQPERGASSQQAAITHAALALEAAEKAKARGLLDLLSESPTAIRQSVNLKLLENRQTIQQRLLAKETAHERLSGNPTTRKQAEEILKERNALSMQLQLLEADIRKSSPHFAALTETQLLSATEIQQLLVDNTVLLEFSLGKKQSWLWAVTRSSIDSYPLPAKQEIEPAARQVYELLTARQPQKGESQPQYEARVTRAETSLQAQAAILGQLLLGPIATKLQSEWKGKRLIIVAPGTLEYIPFAALLVAGSQPPVADEQKSAAALSLGEQRPIENQKQAKTKDQPPATGYRPLIVDHEIINIPSASVLAVIRRETEGRKPAEKLVAVIADPVFEQNDPRVLNARKKITTSTLSAKVRSGNETSVASEGQSSTAAEALGLLNNFRLVTPRAGFSRLPFSREEAEAIASLAPKNSLMKATDFQATRSVATSGDLSRFRILHFATHGLLNSERPELSGLVLSLVDEHGKPQNGFLRMHEIYNLQLPAELIVLSACQTALGKQIRGEGLVGLTRGFMYAGAERVVASLWQVDDLATAELMKRFYRAMLKDGMRPAQALRAAQLDMLKQPRWSSPYFWAAFTIQGEWR
jgi:CHAT domain-containing protein